MQTVNSVETARQPLEVKVQQALGAGVPVPWRNETAEALPMQVQLWCLLSDQYGLVYHYLVADEKWRADGRVEQPVGQVHRLVKITDE